MQGHTAPKWYSLDLNSGSPARVHSLNHIKSSSLPRAVETRTEQNAFLVAPCTLQDSDPCSCCKSSNCSVHFWSTWQAAVTVSDGGCHEGPRASTKAAGWEKPPGLSQQCPLLLPPSRDPVPGPQAPDTGPTPGGAPPAPGNCQVQRETKAHTESHSLLGAL